MAADSGRNGSGEFVLSADWERAAAAAGGTAAFRVRIEAPELPATQRRTPTDVAFVLDRSGSMGGEKIELAKQAVDEACRHLREDDRAALVVFDNEIDVLHRLEPATSRVKTGLRMALLGVDARGGTNLSGGWFAGCQELDPAAAGTPAGQRVRRAILLTDGQANDGIVDPRELGRHANRLRQLGVGTTTLGLGLGFDEFLLSAMAEAGGGNFQFLETAADLREFFEKELRELLSVMALGMQVTVTCPEGVHLHPVSAFPAERTGRTWTLALGEAPAGERLDVVFEATVKPGFAGTEAAFAVEVAWSDPAAVERRSANVPLAPLAVTTPEAAEAAEPHEAAAAAVALQRLAREKRRALEADRRGDRESSMFYARSMQTMVMQAADLSGIDEEREDAAESIRMLLEAPLSEEDRKGMVWKASLQRRNRGDWRERRDRKQPDGPASAPGGATGPA